MQIGRTTRRLFVLGLMFIVYGCSKSNGASATGAASAAAEGKQPGGSITLNGSGASFPGPLYSRWFKEFGDKNQDIRVNYQATGSGAGVKAFTEGQTDFGASDAAMTDAEITEAKNNVVLLPMTAGSIVLAYNLEGVKNLKLSREAYAGIFLGDIKQWNDPKIAKSNPGVTLPAKEITVVHRSDGSGTTFVFTQHLSAISEKWKTGPGTGTSVNWPVGVGGRKNDGIAALLQQTPGAIGYVEYAFAVSGKAAVAALENKAGKFVEANLKSSESALASVELPSDLRAWVTDPSGDESYPIVTYTWVLAKKQYDKPGVATALKKVLKWCLTDGQKLSGQLEYVPLPPPVQARVLKAVDTIQ